MTFFQIADEYERDFEELELEDLDTCAHATLLLVQLGHMSARRMTDGLITAAMLRKRTVTWEPEKLAAALDALVRLGKVARTADGGVQFQDWDLIQFTAEQERKRRARGAERQRRFREKHAPIPNEQSGVHRVTLPATPKAENETIGESPKVTRYVTAPSASSSPSEKERSSISPPSPPAPAPAIPIERGKGKREKPRGEPRKRAPSWLDLAKRRVDEMFHERYQARRPGAPRSTLTRFHELAALQRVTLAYSTAERLDEAAVARSMDAYFADSWWARAGRDGGPAPGYSLGAWLGNHGKYDQAATARPAHHIEYTSTDAHVF